MAEIIVYLVEQDAPNLLAWLNNEPLVWITLTKRVGLTHHWRTVDHLETLTPGNYCLWHPNSKPLNIPSGSRNTSDITILDPASGWQQTLTHESDTPWFGVGHTGVFNFSYKPRGKEKPNAIGRSGFNWVGNYFRSIGREAPLICTRWWSRLGRYTKKSAIGIPWPPGNRRVGAYAFPHAYTSHKSSIHLDLNP